MTQQMFVDIEEIYVQARALDHWAHQAVFENALRQQSSLSVHDLATMRDWRDFFETFLKADILAPLDKRVAWVQSALKEALKISPHKLPAIEMVMVKAQECSMSDPYIDGVLLSPSLRFGGAEVKKALQALEETLDAGLMGFEDEDALERTSLAKELDFDDFFQELENISTKKIKTRILGGKKYSNLSPKEQEAMKMYQRYMLDRDPINSKTKHQNAIKELRELSRRMNDKTPSTALAKRNFKPK